MSAAPVAIADACDALDATIARALAWLEADAARLGGRVTRQVVVGPDGIERAAAYVASAGRAFVVCDTNTFAAAGRKLVALLEARGASVDTWVIEPAAGRSKVVCDDDTVADLSARLPGGALAVAVGSGTVCDTVKLATARAGRPFAAVATAASMNGYTSAIAAVLSKGVKRTVPAHMAEAVFADTAVLAAAPPVMNRAGFGDLVSKPFSHMDWKLAHLV
ncbi:MAG: iron-containing alcohol dehydrogenase, partial [Deltaproteobacteria bacterium]